MLTIHHTFHTMWDGWHPCHDLKQYLFRGVVGGGSGLRGEEWGGRGGRDEASKPGAATGTGGWLSLLKGMTESLAADVCMYVCCQSSHTKMLWPHLASKPSSTHSRLWGPDAWSSTTTATSTTSRCCCCCCWQSRGSSKGCSCPTSCHEPCLRVARKTGDKAMLSMCIT